MSVIKSSVTAFVPDYSPETAPEILQPSALQPRPLQLKPNSTRANPAHYKRFSRTDNLALWYNVTIKTVKQNGPDLTTRQLAVLMSVYLGKGPHTIRALAKELCVTKAAITRAVDRLCKYEFVQRAPDPADGRSVILKRTPAGIQYLQKFADIIHLEMPRGARLMSPAK